MAKQRLGNAQTQYQDLEGTAAADWSDFRGKVFDPIAKKHGMDPNRYHPVGFSFYAGEGGGKPIVSVYAIDKTVAGDHFEAWKEFAAKNKGVLAVDEFDLQVTANEFFSFFKRFHLMLEPGPRRSLADAYEFTPQSEKQ